MYKLWVLLLSLNCVKSLIPHHLPSGQLITFKPNLNPPRSDLIFLEPKKAFIFIYFPIFFQHKIQPSE